jgi:hypothetical protein
MDLLLRFAIALLCLGAAAATFLAVATCRFYAKRAPQGERAMGLIVPLVLLIGAGLAFLLASWCTVGRGSFAPLAPSVGGALLLATGIALGLGGGAFGSFVWWAERRRDDLAFGALVIGLVLPLGGHLLLLGLALEPHPQPIWVKEADIVLAGAAAPGALLGLGLLALAQRMRHRAAAQARQAAEAREAKYAAKRARTPIEKTLEYLATAGQAPVWHLCMSLFHERDGESRRCLVQHIAKRADLVPGLEETLGSEFASLRGGALDFLRELESEPPPVAAAVARSIEILADDLLRSKGERTRTLNAFYEEEIARSREAAERFPDADFRASWNQIRRALASVAERAHRERALQALPR